MNILFETNDVIYVIGGNSSANIAYKVQPVFYMHCKD